MKGNKGYFDLGTIFDEIFEAARNFSDEFHQNCRHFGDKIKPDGFGQREPSEETVDYYPNYFYPPANVYMTSDRRMVFEFALAGFDEKDIELSFQGDYMVFSAKISEEHLSDENIRYFKRRLKLKDIDKQKYFVPLDKYAQENVKAVYKNGILKVTVPPKDEPLQNDGIKIEIVTDSE